jgi:hypothetical protein
MAQLLAGNGSRRAWWLVGFTVLAAVLVATSVGFGRSQRSPYRPVVPSSDVRFIAAPPRVYVDWPLWLSEKTLLVTTVRQQSFSLVSLDLSRGAYRSVATLKPSDCRTSGASRPAWRSREVIYLSDCFPFPARVDSARSVLASLDPRTGHNQRFGPYRFSIAMNGEFSFSPDGVRGVLDSGGLYSRLEWLAPKRVVPLKQGLAIAVAPAWSPDGGLIVFDGVPNASFNDLGSLRTNIYTFKPSAPKQLHMLISGL